MRILIFLLLVMSCNQRSGQLEKAREEARANVDQFIQRLEEGGRFRFIIKTAVSADGHTEYVWLSKVAYEKEGESFKGAVVNDFKKIKSMKKGDMVTVRKDEISDWAVVNAENEVVHGGYTEKVIMEHKDKK